ncbi:Flp family type IVb pilin [Asticcacaulis excentricus]|uniref:Flp/Fap pilin component n=1 Tax=Asticcacaulis excentricus (strain ATCC 15261 / DSM 4724 / KCTC 12464 / NCIMB 9791 / VKM B-1370 / CB 48) TaxID=573065 RepID=E8RQ64_ASTEC|nr:Flp family type IVb pilin [Asticcacaulis excentricus]ADU12121.1 Flp/Fap pilin component [Asticcacaulis excentricus CB 48]
MQIVREFLSDKSGATAIEYALIASLVFLAASGAILAYGESFKNMYSFISAKLTPAIG